MNKIRYDLKRIDLKIGKEGERQCKKFLKEIYPKSDGYMVKAFKYKYNPFDFAIIKDGEIIHEYEVKNRSCSFSQYPSLMFGETKLDYVKKQLQKKPDKKFTFLWLLNDDNFYGWDYQDNEDHYEARKGRNAKNNEKWKNCIYVYTKFISQLTFFE